MTQHLGSIKKIFTVFFQPSSYNSHLQCARFQQADTLSVTRNPDCFLSIVTEDLMVHRSADTVSVAKYLTLARSRLSK